MILAVLAVIFALMHPGNILAVLVDTTIFSVLLLATHNPLASILCHVFNNFLKTVAAALTYFNVINLSMAEGRGAIILFSMPVTLLSITTSVVPILPAALNSIRKNNS